MALEKGIRMTCYDGMTVDETNLKMRPLIRRSLPWLSIIMDTHIDKKMDEEIQTFAHRDGFQLFNLLNLLTDKNLRNLPEQNMP